MRTPLTVTVNKDLVLDARTCEAVSGPDGPGLLLRPPRTTLFHHVLAYLREKPDPVEKMRGSTSDREGIAAAAATLRWGSYLAVLLDSAKPVWSEVKSPATSRISDQEMARINIEVSAAVAEWVDLCRADRNQRLYLKLVDRAVSYLPIDEEESEAEVQRIHGVGRSRDRQEVDRGLRWRFPRNASAPKRSAPRAVCSPTRSPTTLGGMDPWRTYMPGVSTDTRWISVECHSGKSAS